MIKNAPWNYLCLLNTLHIIRKIITYQNRQDIFQLEHLGKEMQPYLWAAVFTTDVCACAW